MRTVLALLGVLAASAAGAAVRFVDGACAVANGGPGSGTGASLTCGATGPFATIAEALAVTAPGDVTNIRGAHGGFDGTYFELLCLVAGGCGTVTGHPLDCSTSTCTFQGCRAAVCGQDEQPVIRTAIKRTDWTIASGTGAATVYDRLMEASPDSDPIGRPGNMDPIMLEQEQPANATECTAAGKPHRCCTGAATGTCPNVVDKGVVDPYSRWTMLGYSGDDVLLPPDGHWSFQTATNHIRVSMAGDHDPATTLFVPNFAHVVHFGSPTAGVTFDHLDYEMPRGPGIFGDSGLGANGQIHMAFRDGHVAYVPRYCILSHVEGLLIDGIVCQDGCRGWSFSQPRGDGCFGFREFGMHNGTISHNVVRHLGATGIHRGSGSGNGWDCPWCDPPWNDPTWTFWSATGTGTNVKQTETATITGNEIYDLSQNGITIDVDRHVAVTGNNVHQVREAIGLRNFTPVNSAGVPTGCTVADLSADPAESRNYCANSDIDVIGNMIDEAGFADLGDSAIGVIGGAERHVRCDQQTWFQTRFGFLPPPCVYLVHVENNFLSHVALAAITLWNGNGSIPTNVGGSATPSSDAVIAHNSIWGERAGAGAFTCLHPIFPVTACEPRGIIVRDQTNNVRLADNVVAGVGATANSTGIVLAAAALSDPNLGCSGVGTWGSLNTVVPCCTGVGTGTCPRLSIDGDVMGNDFAAAQMRWNDGTFGNGGLNVPTTCTSPCTTGTMAAFHTAWSGILPASEATNHTGALLFADLTASPPNLHLTTGSIAIDTGVNAGVTTDIDGGVRPQGAGYDAGADEYGAAPNVIQWQGIRSVGITF